MPEFSREAAFEMARQMAKKAAETVGDIINEAPRRKKEIALGVALAGAGLVGAERYVSQEEAKGAIETQLMTGEEVEKDVFGTTWEAESVSAIRLMVKEQRGETVYHLLKEVLGKDPVYKQADAENRVGMIDAAIALTRALNTDIDLDDFPSLVGKEIVFPVEFSWSEKEKGELYDKKRGGYGALQEAAEKDGFPVRKGSQQEIFNRAIQSAVDVPLQGEGFFLDREGSEDSPAKLAPDVVQAIQELGVRFAAFDPSGDTTPGWSFVVTDMVRDPAAQSKRDSIKESTHPTGRSFDISDGQWVMPSGEKITWTVDGKKGPNADFIDAQLRPAFVQMAKEEGWLLYKEPGHWHVYLPKEEEQKALTIDLAEEWAGYLAVEQKSDAVELLSPGEAIPQISHKIAEKFLGDAEAFSRERIGRKELLEERDALKQDISRFFSENGQEIRRPFLTVLSQFQDREDVTASMPEPEDREMRKAWLKARVIALLRSADPQDIAGSEMLIGTTLHWDPRDKPKKGPPPPPLANLEEIWKWKRDHKVGSAYKPHVAYVAERVGPMNHEVSFADWYRTQQEVQVMVLRHAEKLRFHPALVAYMTPEVMVSLTQAEFTSELNGNTYRQIVPALFEGYNIVRGPAINDAELSAGPSQLIGGTFFGLLEKYGAAARVLTDKDPVFGDIVVPQKSDGKYPVSDVAEAMVLHADSVIFWSYIAALDHAGRGFDILMGSDVFQEMWESASEEDRLLFVASLTPLAINGGTGRSSSAGRYLLKNIKQKTLRDLAFDLRESTTHATAARGAAEGFDCMTSILESVE